MHTFFRRNGKSGDALGGKIAGSVWCVIEFMYTPYITTRGNGKEDGSLTVDTVPNQRKKKKTLLLTPHLTRPESVATIPLKTLLIPCLHC